MTRSKKIKYFIKHFIFIHIYMIIFFICGGIMSLIDYAENNVHQRVNLHIDFFTSLFSVPYLFVSIILLIKKKYYKSVIYFSMFFYFITLFSILANGIDFIDGYLGWIENLIFFK